MLLALRSQRDPPGPQPCEASSSHQADATGAR